MNYQRLQNTYDFSVLTKYHHYRPALTHMHPHNVDESKEVEKRLKNMSDKELKMFKESDKHFTNMFGKIVGEDPKKLDIFLNKTINPYIISIKGSINRARPFQVNNFIENNRIFSTTVHTPAFPAGHTMQSLFLAKNLARLYPDKEDELLELAELIGQARIAAGHHYPSDHKYGKWLINNIYIDTLENLT